MNLTDKIIPRAALGAFCRARREAGQRIVFTNGCFDVLHAGHVDLLHTARQCGDCLVVGLNSDASVRRLKGPSRPVHDEAARALVLAGLGDVDAVCIFEEDTPVELIAQVRPHVHVKGGDYRPDDLPEAATVRAGGGEIHIVPLRTGFSTTAALARLGDKETRRQGEEKKNQTAALAPGSTSPLLPVSPSPCLLIIPARYGSTRFPGKPLALLDGQPVIEHVVRAGLRSQVERPVWVATDDERIAEAVRRRFAPGEAMPVMTSSQCRTGTDRLAETVRSRLGEADTRRIIINVQGDEPFINPAHIDALAAAMQADPALDMATLATPISDAAQRDDPNVVKVVLDQRGHALYFSRLPIPLQRDRGDASAPLLRHLGVYAYSAQWLLKMAGLPSTPLEEIEKLEQLRALENGVAIQVLTVANVVNIAIDTPQDLAEAERFLTSVTR